MIASPSGGVLQGDRLRMSVEVRAGRPTGAGDPVRDAAVPDAGPRGPDRGRVRASAVTRWLEYVPDPYIPFAGSDTTIDTVVLADRDATVSSARSSPRAASPGRDLRDAAVREHARRDRPRGASSGSAMRRCSTTARTLADAGMLGGNLTIGSLFVIAAGADPDCTSRGDRRPRITRARSRARARCRIRREPG